MSLNTVTLSGNLGADAELRFTQGGTAVMTVSLAVTERIRCQDGTWSDRANWIRCTMFGKRAEALAPYLKRGHKISVSGHLHQSTWKQDGQPRSAIEVRLDEVELMSSPRQRQESAAEVPPALAPEPAPMPEGDFYGDDIPF